MAAPTAAVRRVRIEIDSAKAKRQMDALNRNMKKTATAAQGLRNSFVKLNSALAILGGAHVVGNVIKSSIDLVDTYRELGGRINLVVKETVGLEQAQADLNKVARETYTSYDAIGTLYSRMGMATKELGASHQQLLDVTQTVANTLRLSGASAQEARSSMLQFSQALSAGALQGDEFRSLSENNVALMDLFSDALGVTRGELKKMSAEGLLTTNKMFQALLENVEKLQGKVDNLPITVGRAMTNLTTEWQKYLVEMDKSLGLTDSLAESMKFLADNTGTLVKLAKELLVIWAVAKITAIAVAWMKIVTAMKATVILQSALTKGKTLLYLGAAVAGFAVFESQFGALAGSALDSMSDIDKQIIDLDIEIRNATETLTKMQTQYDALAANPLYPAELLKNQKLAVDKQREEVELLKEKKNLLLGITKAEENTLTETPIVTKGKGKSGPTAAGVTAENIQQLERQQELLRQQQERLTLSGEELSRFNIAMDASNQMYTILAAAKAKDITLTGEQRAAIHGLVLENAELAESLRKQKEATDKAQEPLNEMAVAIGNTLSNATRDAAGALIDFATGVETNFADMAKSVVKSIARVILELQLLSALKAAFPTLFPKTAGAKGLAVAHGELQPVHAFASGGIVTQPTFFPMARGGIGLMGESGSEAVMPLRRTRNGDLGVAASGGAGPVNVVINNNAPVDVTAEEHPNAQGGIDITLFVERKIESYFDSGGGDRLLGTAFGARRMPR